MLKNSPVISTGTWKIININKIQKYPLYIFLYYIWVFLDIIINIHYLIGFQVLAGHHINYLKYINNIYFIICCFIWNLEYDQHNYFWYYRPSIIDAFTFKYCTLLFWIFYFLLLETQINKLHENFVIFYQRFYIDRNLNFSPACFREINNSNNQQADQAVHPP